MPFQRPQVSSVFGCRLACALRAIAIVQLGRVPLAVAVVADGDAGRPKLI
jgi:hypothetical protein